MRRVLYIYTSFIFISQVQPQALCDFIDSTCSLLHKVTSEIRSKQKDVDVLKLSPPASSHTAGTEECSRVGNVLCTLQCFAG